jgi:hypothetical protein
MSEWFFDGTKSELNAALWAPWFSLLTYSSLTSIIEPGTLLGYTDNGEIFLNCLMEKSICPFAGFDLTSFLGKKGALVFALSGFSNHDLA